MPRNDAGALGPTRLRDLAAVAVVAALAGYALTRFNYSRLPTLPRLAGVSAAVIGLAEAAVGYVLRRRIRDTALRDRTAGRRGLEPGRDVDDIAPSAPVPPLMAARMLGLAKASALAGAAFAGLWVGVGVYVLPDASRTASAAADGTTAVIGLIGAVLMIVGALILEYSCRIRRAD